MRQFATTVHSIEMQQLAVNRETPPDNIISQSVGDARLHGALQAALRHERSARGAALRAALTSPSGDQPRGLSAVIDARTNPSLFAFCKLLGARFREIS